VADFCFVHAADLHLDAPCKGLSRSAPDVATALREASLGALRALVDLCIDRGAAFLVLAGDLYDGPDHGLRAQLQLREGLERLSDAGIWTFIVHGNHDPLETGWSAVSGDWPERVVVFPAGGVGCHVVERSGQVLAVVQGISYPRRDVRENLAVRFGRQLADALHVGVLHCAVTGSSDDHAPYSPCSLEDLRATGLDYWALGHIHSRRVLSGTPHGDEPWVVYPGNLQGRSHKPTERGSKGATVVTVHGRRVGSVEHVACDQVRFEMVEIDLGAAGIETLPELRDALGDAALGLLDASEGRSLVLRAGLRGRSRLAPELKRPGVADDLLESLREDAPIDAGQFCWWDELDDGTRPDVDLDRLAEGTDFVADVIASARAVLAEADRSQASKSTRSAMTDGLPAALRQRAERLVGDDPELLSELVSDALTVALDGLGVGSEVGEQ
jgi:exonuclease SbcD